MTPIHKNGAAEFTEKYCSKFSVDWHGDPNYGHEVLWYGVLYKGDLRAVIGFVDVPGGTLVWGLYGDNSVYAPRALLALTKLAYGMGLNLFAYVRKDNDAMLAHCYKHSWEILAETDSKNEWLLRRTA